MGKVGPDRTVTDDQLVQAIKTDRRPAVTAGVVASKVGISRQRVSQLLKQLAESGEVQTDKINGHTRIYWLESSDDGSRSSKPAEVGQ